MLGAAFEFRVDNRRFCYGVMLVCPKGYITCNFIVFNRNHIAIVRRLPLEGD